MSVSEQTGIAFLLDRMAELDRERTLLLAQLRKTRRSRDMWRQRYWNAKRADGRPRR